VKGTPFGGAHWITPLQETGANTWSKIVTLKASCLHGLVVDSLVRHGNQRQQWQRPSDETGQRVKAFARDRIESLPYQLDGSVLGYHGDNGYVELGFDSGEGA